MKASKTSRDVIKAAASRGRSRDDRHQTAHPPSRRSGRGEDAKPVNGSSHVHVGKEGKEAKYWMMPIALAKSRGFRDHELNEIERILAQYRDDILEAWRKEQEKRGNR